MPLVKMKSYRNRTTEPQLQDLCFHQSNSTNLISEISQVQLSHKAWSLKTIGSHLLWSGVLNAVQRLQQQTWLCLHTLLH